MVAKKMFIVGGAGFIGSHFTDHLLADASIQKVTLFDNFSSGREWHYAAHISDPRFQVIRGDVKDLEALKAAMKGHDGVIHLASNPDISKAVTEPDIDFREGTVLTQNVLEAMRIVGVKRLLYASGSGVYGDTGFIKAREDYSPMTPISTYGASKLAGEALISSYCFMFNLTACCFRFGNVVGPRQTHGVGFDFARRLLADPTHLKILGDGTQNKSYIYIRDVVSAVLLANEKTTEPLQIYNVATEDTITVEKIAQIAIRCVGLKKDAVRLEYAGGDRGWKGDVPIVRLNTERIQKLGWKCQRSSEQALEESIRAMIPDIQQGRLC